MWLSLKNKRCPKNMNKNYAHTRVQTSLFDTLLEHHCDVVLAPWKYTERCQTVPFSCKAAPDANRRPLIGRLAIACVRYRDASFFCSCCRLQTPVLAAALLLAPIVERPVTQGQIHYVKTKFVEMSRKCSSGSERCFDVLWLDSNHFVERDWVRCCFNESKTRNVQTSNFFFYYVHVVLIENGLKMETLNRDRAINNKLCSIQANKFSHWPHLHIYIWLGFLSHKLQTFTIKEFIVPQC